MARGTRRLAALLGATGGALVLACGSDPTANGPGPNDASSSSVDAATSGGDANATADTAAGSGTWSSRASLPGPQQETSVVEVAGKIWVIGGFNGAGQVVADVLVYDPQANSWAQGPALPEPLHHTNAAVVSGSIFVLGGLRGTNFEAVGLAWELAPGATQWTPKASLPAGTQRGSSFIGAIGQKIYVAGGLRNGSVTDAHVYDVATNAWSQIVPLPQARDHGMSAVVGGVLYAIGGRGTGIGAHTAEVLAYDPAQDRWSTRAAMPTSRGGGMAAVVDGKVIVCGGEGNGASPSGVFSQTERFDPVKDAWEPLAPMKTPRHGTGAASFAGVMYVPGGADKQAFGPVATMEALVFP
jgi:N-acetylneuraminic acid mutarotase